MKNILRNSVLIFFAVAVQAMAAFESVKLDSASSVMPQFPLKLVLDGTIEGHVIFAISVGANGRVNDSLALEYSHEPFVRVCREALKDWRFVPAKFDGENVSVQLVLRFDFRREGFVETNSFNIANNYIESKFGGLSGRRLEYRLARASELDRGLSPATTVGPLYARQAADAGVRGNVTVFFYVDEKGDVRFPSVTADAHPYLADLAVTALRHWHFDPPTNRGKGVLVAATQEFKFGG